MMHAISTAVAVGIGAALGGHTVPVDAARAQPPGIPEPISVKEPADPTARDALKLNGEGATPWLESIIADKMYLGRLRPGTTGTRRIVLRNSSSRPLRLEVVSTTCGCTRAALSDLEVAPLATSTLTMTISAQSGRDRTTQRVDFSATALGGGEEVHQRYAAYVSYEPDEDYAVQPGRLELYGPVGSLARGYVVLDQDSATGPTIKAVGTDESRVTARVDRDEGMAPGFRRIEVSSVPDSDTTRRALLRVDVESAQKPTFSIQVVVHPTGLAGLAPRAVVFSQEGERRELTAPRFSGRWKLTGPDSSSISVSMNGENPVVTLKPKCPRTGAAALVAVDDSGAVVLDTVPLVWSH